MDVQDESLAELFEQYKDEVRESIGVLDSELVAIEQDPANSEVIFSIFRHLHSLKGSSKMFNVDNLGHIAHKLEDLMQMIDQDNSILGQHPQIVDLLFRGADIFREIIDRLENDISYINLTPQHAAFIEEVNRQLDHVSSREKELVEAARRMIDEVKALLPGLEPVDVGNISQALNRLENSVAQAEMDSGSDQARYTYGQEDISGHIRAFQNGIELFESGEFSAEDVQAFKENADGLLQVLFGVAEEDIMDILGELNDGLEMMESRDLEVDALVIEFFSMLLQDLLPKLNIASGGPGPGGPAALAETEAEGAEAALQAPEPAAAQAKTIRVDEKKIDLFLESVGKLITQSEILNHLQYSFKQAGVSPSLIREFGAVNRTISNDIVTLQRSIMEVRQVEMDNILKKFPRLVRDISHKMGKEVELAVSGGRIPIDKSLLDDVEQALIHIVRNAIDHGLELPEERAANGKNPRGLIRIDVVQEEAAIKVVTSDDGRGVDFEGVRRRAVDKGLVGPEEAAGLTEEEVKQLVFRSGVTTKTEATDISGRGVGLDVVLSNISKWNGEVTLDSVPGRGTTMGVRIPITNTLLTKEAILLRLGEIVFSLPLEYIVEIVTVPADKIHSHRGQEVFQHRDKVILVMDIKKRLGMDEDSGSGNSRRTYIILRGALEEQQAIAADEILGQQKIVIKDFEVEDFRRLPYFQGLTLLGDGRVVLILDPEKILS